MPIFAWNVLFLSLVFLKRFPVFPILLFSSVSLHSSIKKVFFFKKNHYDLFKAILTFFFFLLYNIVLVLPYINMNLPRVYTCSQSWTPLPPPSHTIPLGHPSAPAPSILCHTSNMDWWFISHMISNIFQCHSPKSSPPLPLPQSPKDYSIHLCLFCCLAYRVVIPIFINSIYISMQTLSCSMWDLVPWPGICTGRMESPNVPSALGEWSLSH